MNDSKKIKIIGIIFAINTLFTFIFSFPLLEISLAFYKKGYVTVKEIDGVNIEQVIDNSPASQAVLKKGDIITKIGNTKINSVEDYLNYVTKNKGKLINGEILREDDVIKFQLTPRINYPPNEGPTGIVVSNYQLIPHDQKLLSRLTDALIKPYLGYESLPKSGVGGLYTLTTVVTSDYLSYNYTGNFSYSINLLFSILLLFTTIGVLKRRKYGAYLAIVVGVLIIVSLIYETIILIKLQNTSILLGVNWIWDILLVLLCTYIFTKRDQFVKK